MFGNKVKTYIIAVLMGLAVATPAAATDWGYMSKEFALDIAARAFYRAVLSQFSNSVTDTILTGDKTRTEGGEPLFVTNWRDFVGEGQFRGENQFRAQLNETGICGYIKDGLQAIFGASDIEAEGRSGLPSDFNTKAAISRLHPYELSARCTLATIEGFGENEGEGSKNEQERFLENFINSTDGWGSYQELLQPQNNFFGAFGLANQEFRSQSNFEQELSKLEAVAGGGFVGTKQTEEDGDIPGCIYDAQGRCVVLGEIRTPGGIISETAAKIFTAEFDWITTADEISEVVSVVLAGYLNKLLDFRSGSSIEEGAEPEPPTDKRDIFNIRECIRQCETTPDQIDQVCTGSISTSNGGDTTNGSGGDGTPQLDIYDVVTLGVRGQILAQVDDFNQSCEGQNNNNYSNCVVRCMRFLGDLGDNADEINFCPEGTRAIGDGARNGAEFLDDFPMDRFGFTGGTVELVCGRGLGETNGTVYIAGPPPTTCAEAGITDPVREIPPNETPRATNVSTFCLGDQNAPFDISILNPVAVLQCSETGQSTTVSLPPGTWYAGAAGPGTATAEVCQPF